MELFSRLTQSFRGPRKHFISGPVTMSLYGGADRKYLIVSDKHTSFQRGACRQGTGLLFPEYLDKLFRDNPDSQWDFYLEQGSYDIENEDEVISFLSEMDTVLTDTERKKLLTLYRKYKETSTTSKRQYSNERDKDGFLDITLLNLCMIYFKGKGCFLKDKKICKKPYPNARFHYIDIRQSRFGTSCKMPNLKKYSTFRYPSGEFLSGLISDCFKNYSGIELIKKEIEAVIKYYINTLRNTIACFSEPKLLKQLEASTMTEELDQFFEAPKEILIEIMEQDIECFKTIKEFSEYILKREKRDIGEIVIEYKKLKYGKPTWDRLFNKLSSSDYFKNYYGLNPYSTETNLEVSQEMDVWQEAQVLLLDMYALARMTRPFNRNVVVLAGYMHCNNYKYFFHKYLGKEGWDSEHSSDKCAKIPLDIPWITSSKSRTTTIHSSGKKKTNKKTRRKSLRKKSLRRKSLRRNSLN